MSKLNFSYNTPSLEEHYQGINSAGKRSFMMIRSCQQQPEDRLGRNAPCQNRPSDDVNRDRALLFFDQFEDAIEDDSNEYKEISHKASMMSSPRTVPLSPCVEEVAKHGNNGNSKEEETEKMMVAEVIIQLGNHKHLAAAVSDDDNSISSPALTTHKIPQSPRNIATIVEGTIPATPSLDDKDNNGGNSSIDLLQALQYSLHDPKWIENYYHLKAYKDQNGHCNVNEGSQLSRWVQEQRVAFEKNNLEMNQKHLLDDIGFVWSSGLSLTKTKKKGNNQNNNGGGAFSDKKWFGHYTKLVEYKKRNGHCNVPQHGEGKLGPWVKRQREELKKNKLCKHRQELLNQIGFVWKMARSAPFDNARWLEKYDELKLYQQQNGHCNVPTREGKLGMWVNRQRSEFSKQKMRPDRKNLLDAIGFAWTTGRYSITKCFVERQS